MEQSATEIAAAVRAGDMTARQAAETALARIAERDSAINAFQVVRAEAALREADAVDSRADRFSLPLASAAAAPPDEPPGVNARLIGLRVTPKDESVAPNRHSSGTRVMPTTTAPAARSRATASASC